VSWANSATTCAAGVTSVTWPAYRAMAATAPVTARLGGVGLFQLGDAVGQRGRVGALQHAQPAGPADGDGQLRGHHPTAHGGQLDRDLAANQLGKGRPQHAEKNGTSAGARAVDRDLAAQRPVMSFRDVEQSDVAGVGHS
jgi:hypothetical protein